MFRLLFLSLLLLSLQSHATDTLNVESKLNGATVFFTGSELHHQTSVNLKSGRQFLKINDLPIHLDPESIQIQGGEGITIRSVSAEHEIFSTRKTKAEEAIFDQILNLDIAIARLSEEYNVLTEEEELLVNNQDLGSSRGSKLEEIKAAASFYRIRYQEIRNRKIDIKLELRKKDEAKRDLLLSQKSLNKAKRIYAYILVELEAEKPMNIDLKFSYFIESAGWNPTYDFRVKSIQDPIEINYKAEIFQSSGFDWKDIQLTLSTASPSQSGNKPSLNKWYLTHRDPQDPALADRNFGGLKGVVIDKTGEPLPWANIHILKSGEIVYVGQADAEGRFRFNPLPTGRYQMKVYYLGFEDFALGVNILRDQIANVEAVIQSRVNPLQEVVVANFSARGTQDRVYSTNVRNSQMAEGINIRGSRSAANDVYIDGIKVRGSSSLPQSAMEGASAPPPSYISTSLKKAVLNHEYLINTPYSIPSNGEIYTVQFNQVNRPVDFEFQIVPRLSNDAYLVGLLTNWDELNFVSGPVQIFYEGTFQGKSFLSTEVIADTLEISLGRDKGIVVSRVSDKENLKWFNMGNFMKEQVAWTIEVFNSKPSDVRIVVKDQYPFSDHSSIDIELGKAPGARVDETKGILEWKDDLPSGGKATYRYYYTLEYPSRYQHLFR